MPNIVAFQDSEGNTEVAFAQPTVSAGKGGQTTDTKHVIGPGAIDPQDGNKLFKVAGGYTQIDYSDVSDNEYSTVLRDREGMIRWYKMLDDDTVSNTLNYIFGAIRSMPYFIQYASEDPADLQAAAFISDQLGFEGTKAGKYTFQRLIRIFEQSLVYGVGYGEIVLKMVNGQGVLDAIIPYHPLVVEKVLRTPQGGPLSVKIIGRIKGDGGASVNTEIPMYKMIMFVNDDDGDLKGRSILRSAYVPYEIKRVMTKLVTSGFERYLLGVPVFKAPPGVNNQSAEWQLAKQMGMKFAGNPKSGLTIPNNWEFEVMSVNAQMPDALPYITMMNEAIGKSMGVEHNVKGQAGPYGHTSQLIQISERTIKTYIDNFVDYVNTFLIPKLMVVNFPDVVNYPMLSYSDFAAEVPAPLIQLIQGMLQMSIQAPQAAQAPVDNQSQASGAGSNSTPANTNAKANVVGTKGGGVALNSTTANTATPTSIDTSTKTAPLDAAAGGFNTDTFNSMMDSLPSRLKDQLGYNEDKRNQLLGGYRTSASTAYKVKKPRSGK